MAFKLPDSIYSVEQLEAIIFELREYVDWSRSASIKSKLKSDSPALPAPAWSAEMQAVVASFGAGKALSTGDVEELIKALMTFKKKAPLVHLTLAGMPGPAQRAQIMAWFRDNVNPHVLLTFAANRTILGGMVVRAGSHIYDLSWRREFLAKREKLVEVVSNVRK